MQERNRTRPRDRTLDFYFARQSHTTTEGETAALDPGVQSSVTVPLPVALQISSDEEDGPALTEPVNPLGASRCFTLGGIYVAGVYPLSFTEADLRYAFAAQQIYRIRNVDVRGFSLPDSCRIERLAFSMVVHGQVTWTQLQRLSSWLPSDKRVRWNPSWGVEEPEHTPSRFTTGALEAKLE